MIGETTSSCAHYEEFNFQKKVNLPNQDCVSVSIFLLTVSMFHPPVLSALSICAEIKYKLKKKIKNYLHEVCKFKTSENRKTSGLYAAIGDIILLILIHGTDLSAVKNEQITHRH